MLLRKFVFPALVLCSAVLSAHGPSPNNGPPGNTVVVAPDDMDGWSTYEDPGSEVSFVEGPGDPPCGTGSAQFQIGPDGNEGAELFTSNFDGMLLADLTQLAYSTYVQGGGSGGQAPYIILTVDNNNDGRSDDLLFFEPVYQTGAYGGDPVPNQGTVQEDVWQDWNARVGGWWSLNAGTFGPPLVTLDSYIAAHPDATLVSSGGFGAVSIATGYGAGAWDNFIGNADCFTIGFDGESVTYDFEAQLPDEDDDGVPDVDDHCPGSDLRPKVDTGGGPTSINNTVDDHGCSIQDLVNQCAANPKNHGQYVKCVGELADDLYRQGVITQRQRQEMKNGAAKSSVGKKSK